MKQKDLEKRVDELEALVLGLCYRLNKSGTFLLANAGITPLLGIVLENHLFDPGFEGANELAKKWLSE